jgi:hypothetical protein
MKNKMNLGFSANSVRNVLKNKNWVEIYKNELHTRMKGLNITKFPQCNYAKNINFYLEEGLDTDISHDIKGFIRSYIASWMQISHLKSYSVIKSSCLIKDQLEDSLKILQEYEDIPIGPQGKRIIKETDGSKVTKYFNGNLMIFYSEASISNTLGLFVSELFFAIEAMLRVICIGSCLEFAIKSILPHIVIQHDEIHKTLKRLGKNESEKVTCRLCVLKHKCIRKNQYLILASLYELFYHLRVIKDYRREFYFNDLLSDFIITEYISKGMNILFKLDNIVKRIFSDYMTTPYSLSDHKKRILKLSAQIKN